VDEPQPRPLETGASGPAGDSRQSSGPASPMRCAVRFIRGRRSVAGTVVRLLGSTGYTRPHHTQRDPNRHRRAETTHCCWQRPVTTAGAFKDMRLSPGAGDPVGRPVGQQLLRCELAAALGRADGFPVLGDGALLPRVLRRLRHVPAPSAEHEPARHRPGQPDSGRSPGRFPRSPRTDRRVRCPTLPLRHRYEYAAGFPRGHLPAISPGAGVAHHRWACIAPRPISARLEPVSPGSGCPPLHRPAATDQPWSPSISTR